MPIEQSDYLNKMNPSEFDKGKNLDQLQGEMVKNPGRAEDNASKELGKLAVFLINEFPSLVAEGKSPVDLVIDFLRETKKVLAGNGMELATAVGIFVKELRKDQSEGSYYFGWQSNIAMAFFDECISQGSEMGREKLHEICNAGAKRFLNNLIH
jgi:hypothetical protein